MARLGSVHAHSSTHHHSKTTYPIASGLCERSFSQPLSASRPPSFRRGRHPLTSHVLACSASRGPSGREWHVSSTGRVTRPPSIRALNLDPAPDLTRCGTMHTSHRCHVASDARAAASSGERSQRERTITGSASAHRARHRQRKRTPRPLVGMMPRLDLRLRVNPIQRIMTVPVLLNLTVPRLPCGSAGGTTGFGRFSSHRLGLAPSVACASSREGSPRSRAARQLWVVAQAHTSEAQALSPTHVVMAVGLSASAQAEWSACASAHRPQSLCPCPEGHPALRLRFAPPMHPRVKHRRARPQRQYPGTCGQGERA